MSCEKKRWDKMMMIRYDDGQDEIIWDQMMRWDKTRQDKTRWDKVRWERIWQDKGDKIKQDKIRQNMTR